jgi:hypothetical protein
MWESSCLAALFSPKAASSIMKLITCQHEWVEVCTSRYRCDPPVGFWFEDAHYPLSEKLGGTFTVRLWYPDHIVQGALQTIEYNYPCIFTRNVDELKILTEVYPEYVETYKKAEFISKSYAGSLGAAAGFASDKYRSSQEYTETRKKSGQKAWKNKTGAFSEEGVRKRLEKRSNPVIITTTKEVLRFPSITAAAKHFNVDRATICRWKKSLPVSRLGIIDVSDAPK